MIRTAARARVPWRAVGFDLDGTLFDHRGAATEAVKGFLAELGGEPAPDAVRAWFDLEARHFEAWRAGRVSFADQRRLRINDFLELMGMPVPRDPAAAGALFTRYLVRYRRAWRAFDDAVPVLHRLRAEGARIGVLTNGDHAQQID